MNTSMVNPRQELDRRTSGGLEVTLYWDPDDDSMSVEVHQPQTGETINIPVPPDRALEAFHHPFALLARGYEPTAELVEV